MKYLFGFLAALCMFAGSAQAELTAAEQYKLNKQMGSVGRQLQLGTLLSKTGVQTGDGLHYKQVARATYDVAVEGGGIAAVGLGQTLPANAIVTQAWFQIITQFADSGSGTVALHCAGANDLFSAADITGSAAGAITAGVPIGTAATMFDVGATACELTATVATATQTAGKLVLWVEYVETE